MAAALSATFEPTESRVRLELTGADGSTLATFYRRRGATTLYDIVRGGFQVAVSGGSSAAVFDYEFPAGADPAVTAEYRVLATPLGSIFEDFEDATLAVTVGGTWARSSTTAAAGTWSFKSAVIGHSAQSDATVTVPDDATSMSFMYRVSSEAAFDFFRVLVDGVQVLNVSGDSGWVASSSFTVAPGGTITFRYLKDSATASLLDAAFIDSLTFVRASGYDESDTVPVTIEGEAWLKFPGYPYLNRQLTVTGRSGIARSTRGDLVQVVNTRAPVAVQEFMTGRSCSLIARTETWEEYVELDTALGLGGVLFLHADEAELGLPSMYATATGIESETGARAHTARRYTTINLAEVSAPGYAYAGTLGTWQTILTTYPTWQDVLDEPLFTSWSALLELEGSPSDVIVG
ncbi:MAG: hypothetical protein L0I24_00230 [Pseudonocardia sp.]|nr:hypothetical protein [Pseudonocardia sp.]